MLKVKSTSRTITQLSFPVNSLMLFRGKDANAAGAERLIGEWLGGQAMAAVKAIPPQRREPSLKKVAAYCRVSTKSHEQSDSLTAQECYCEEQIKANPNWKFARIYSDIGSGTTIKGRNEVQCTNSCL